MNEWIIWPVGIALWLIVGIALFFVFELPPLLHGDTDGRVTLSMWVWTLFQKFPLSIMWLQANFFMIIGALMTHFFWHWCPVGSISGG